MGRWRASLALAALAATLPAVAQDAPKSILPPGFEVSAPRVAVPEPAPEAIEDAATPGEATPGPTAAPLPRDPMLAPPPPLPAGGAVGWLTPQAGGYGEATFAGSNGKFLTALMRRTKAPIASRWGEIVLRRALLSVVPPPPRVAFADWIAERAWLLVRLGEVDGAKVIVDQVPVGRFSPRLYEVAAQVDLAAADVPALCPLGPTAATLSNEALWPMVNAMCAGIEGDDITAAAIFDTVRARGHVDAFDLQLAERVANSGSGNGRAANIDWESAGRLTAFRFGLARAAGLPIPQALVDQSPAAVKAWTLRSAGATLEARVAVAPTVAAMGVSSAAEIVSLFAAQGAELDPFAFDASTAGRLRAAYVARNPADRLAALRTIWQRGDNEAQKYGLLILTGQAAALSPVGDNAEAEASKVAAMLAAGLIDPALRRAPLAAKSGTLWALLAVVSPDVVRDSRFSDWQAAEAKRVGETRAARRAQLLAACLQGLGKGDWSSRLRKLGVPEDANAFTAAIDAAAAGGRRGEVALLAGIGLQGSWRGVPPQHLRHILAAYRRVGLDVDARLLAAEAITRG